LVKTYQERVSILENAVNATIPPDEVLRQMRDNSIQLATTLGASAQELIDNDFLTPEDIEDIKQLKSVQATTVDDPALIRKRQDEKERLRQDMERRGASPAEISIALADFDQQTEEAVFQRGTELSQLRSQQISSRIGLRGGLRQQGFNQAAGGLDALFKQLGFAREGVAQSEALAGSKVATGFAGVKANQGLRVERGSLFERLGKFKFSGRTQEALREGRVGPGTVGEQISARQGSAIFTPEVASMKQGLNPADFGGQGSFDKLNQFVNRASDEELLGKSGNFLRNFLGGAVDSPDGQGNRQELIQREIQRRRLIG
jgi:hypothetical protein